MLRVAHSLRVPLLALFLAACSGSGDGAPPDASTDGHVASDLGLADLGGGDLGGGDLGGADLGCPTCAPDAGSGDAGGVDAAGPDLSSGADLDGDGLADAEELRIASDYLPYLSVSDTDACPRAGILFRMRPHPDDPTRIAATMIMLYENDCGAGGHVGDDEAFGLTIDPAIPAPAGILAVRTISHQGTPCQVIGECGPCPTWTACTTGTRHGMPYPIAWASRDKHGWYSQEGSCDGACFFTNQCDLSSTPVEPALINAGEPGAPLTNDLTTAGLITAANGWTQASLLHFDPWANMNFGGAGNTTGDLMDTAFLTPTCR